MIAVQLSAFQLDDAVVVHPDTVLDVMEETADPGDAAGVERADRSYWEKEANPGFLTAIDNLASMLRRDGVEPRITYNRHHVALGTTGYNFCWFYPPVAMHHCHIEIRLRGDTEQRDAAWSSLVNAGIDASALHTDLLSFSITTAGLQQHAPAIGEVLKQAEELAGARASPR